MTRRSEFLSAPWIHHQSIGSTNAFLMDYPETSFLEGITCSADEQTHGRGRGDRIWTSPTGGIYMSFLLCPPVAVSQWKLVSMLLAYAAACTIRTVYPDVEPRLKWPNDILINRRKVAGVLVQSRLSGKKRLVAGIGINATTPPEKLPVRPLFPATVLNLESRFPVSVMELRKNLREQFLILYETWIHDPQSIIPRWTSLSSMENCIVSLNTDHGAITGRFAGIDSDGSLLLLCDHDSKTRAFTTGDVVTLCDIEGD
ncbi:biotin--[acetyl-CoA-carboxylase] ligase [bacterium]|nr:biotin--[acetyl-CoA-carboxylase] ligase [candidate division CSSED10-310 bacterium]